MLRTLGLCLVLAALAFAGCSPTPKTAKVSGEVTLDGQPLKDGRIQFIPVAGDTGTAGAIITDGKFTTDVPISKMRVEINANKVIGKRKVYEDSPQSPWVEDVRELLLPRYNSSSTLEIDVKPGPQTVKYPLLSK
jgi:hypothetical protein